MKRLARVIVCLLTISVLLLSGCVYEPLEEDLNTRNIYPIVTNTYDIGSIPLQYDGGYFREIYLNGVLLVPGIGLEADPVFTASDAFPITAADIANWNALISSQWVDDVSGIHYTGSVGIHTDSSANALLSLYSSDGISNDPILSVMDNSASVEAVGLRVNMAGAKTDYTDGIYITNICTTATAGSDKYGLRIKNSGNWLGVGSTNYALYIETPVGGTTNYSIYSEGAANYLGGTLTLGNILDMNTHQINNVVDPTLAQDAATKNYVDTRYNYAGMYRYNSAAISTIQQVNDWHLVNGFSTGYLGGGWTWHAGEQIAITAYADNGDGKTKVTVAGHTLINSDVLSISGTTSYDGVWVVEQALVNTFVIDTPWVADDGASVGEHGSHFHSATTTSAGKYLITYSMSVKPGSANCVIEVCTYHNATQDIKSVSTTKLGAITDYQNVVGFSVVDLATNDVVDLAIRNITDGGDFIIIHGNMTLVKLD